MRRRKFLLASLGAAGAALPSSLAAPAPMPALVPAPAPEQSAGAAERILLGRVRPLDSPGAEAEAIANGKILAVGSRNNVMKFRVPARSSGTSAPPASFQVSTMLMLTRSAKDLRHFYPPLVGHSHVAATSYVQGRSTLDSLGER